MLWTEEQLNDHKKAAKLLGQIKDRAFAYIANHPDTTEYEVQQLIVSEFRKHKLRSGVGPPIVAFNESAAEPHYFAKRVASKKITDNTLILIDVWARLAKNGAPYADITWMGYKGKKLASKPLKAFETVLAARDAALKFMKQQLQAGQIPTGKSADLVTEESIKNAGFGPFILHRTGHSLGVGHVHGHRGKYSLSIRNENPILPGIGYTIEPGIYIAGKFGIRSEIDIFITKDLKLIITSEVQKDLVKIN